MDGGTWYAAVHGIAKSRTRLSDFTFTFHFPLSCIGERNGNPLQCSCLENLRDSRAWWAAIYGVAQSGTRLKRLSSKGCAQLLTLTGPFHLLRLSLMLIVTMFPLLYLSLSLFFQVFFFCLSHGHMAWHLGA